MKGYSDVSSVTLLKRLGKN